MLSPPYILVLVDEYDDYWVLCREDGTHRDHYAYVNAWNAIRYIPDAIIEFESMREVRERIEIDTVSIIDASWHVEPKAMTKNELRSRLVLRCL